MSFGREIWRERRNCFPCAAMLRGAHPYKRNVATKAA